MDAKISALKDYAIKNYDVAGWDYFTECCTNDDWLALVNEHKTLAACKKEMKLRAQGNVDAAESCDFEY